MSDIELNIVVASFNPQNNPLRQVLLLVPTEDTRDTEAQRGGAICPSSHTLKLDEVDKTRTQACGTAELSPSSKP